MRRAKKNSLYIVRVKIRVPSRKHLDLVISTLAAAVRLFMFFNIHENPSEPVCIFCFFFYTFSSDLRATYLCSFAGCSFNMMRTSYVRACESIDNMARASCIRYVIYPFIFSKEIKPFEPSRNCKL